MWLSWIRRSPLRRILSGICSISCRVRNSNNSHEAPTIRDPWSGLRSKLADSDHFTLAIAGTLSLLWFICRTGTNPARIRYPCQRAALAQSQIFFASMINPFLGVLAIHLKRLFRKMRAPLLISIVSLYAPGTYPPLYKSDSAYADRSVVLDLRPRLCPANMSVSDVFFVVNASGPEGNMDFGMQRLIDLMEARGLFFYSTERNPSGLFARDDVVIIKVNCQSDRRGGTNTDYLQSLIQTIVNHPEGFDGEIVVADNGQGIGGMDWHAANSFDRRQSVQDVVDRFAPKYRVSTYLWDAIRDVAVSEYDSGDVEDGYVTDPDPDPTTGICVSYPKFKTAFGTYISFRNGIWRNGTYDSAKLKIINTQVLKSHELYGVTGSVKNYMGVQSQPLSNGHYLIGLGAMGTEIAETRFPTLNILDCIWVNANPIEGGVPPCGPVTPYEHASYANVIAASVDPVALDYLASKYVLIPTALRMGYTEVSSLDPDNLFKVDGLWESFHNYLERSMEQLKVAGLKTTMNEREINMLVDGYISKPFQENLIVTDSDATIEGTIDINGSIIVEDAILHLKNATVNFEQLVGGKHNMTLRNSRLISENATITTSGYLPVYLYSSSGSFAELSGANLIAFKLHSKSYVSISDSELDSVHASGMSEVNMSKSKVNRFRCSESSSATVIACTVGQLEISDSSIVASYDSVFDLADINSSHFWLVNSTSNDYYPRVGGAIYVYWYLDVRVVDSDGAVVAFANVTATYSNATVADSKLSDSNGWARLTLMEKSLNAAGTHRIGNYAVTAKHETYEGRESVSMVGNQQVTVNLQSIDRSPLSPTVLLSLVLVFITIVAAAVLTRKTRSIERTS